MILHLCVTTSPPTPHPHPHPRAHAPPLPTGGSKRWAGGRHLGGDGDGIVAAGRLRGREVFRDGPGETRLGVLGTVRVGGGAGRREGEEVVGAERRVRRLGL